MAKYVTKGEIIHTIKNHDDRNVDIDSVIPRLNFNNTSQIIECKNCDNYRATSFKWNISSSSGSNEVIFEWEPNLNRIIVRGHICTDCNWHKIILEYPRIEGSTRENDPDKIENIKLGSFEVISERSATR